MLSYKSYAEHPGFHRFRGPCSLQFILEHSLAMLQNSLLGKIPQNVCSTFLYSVLGFDAISIQLNKVNSFKFNRPKKLKS